jgi:YfiH family protein
MRKMIQGQLSVFKFESSRKYKEITHFITTKEGWIAGDKPRFTGDKEYEYSEFRKELAASGEWKTEQFIFPRQTHSDHVVIVTSETIKNTIEDTDALITNITGMFICVQTADCVPVLLFDPQKKVVAAIHSGWKGTVFRIVQKTIQQMSEKFGCQPSDIVAGIGPSIHLHAYEIGPDVVEAAKASFSNWQALLKPSFTGGKAFFDLWEANKTILVESGVPEENIEVIGLCSFEHARLFFSARREGADTGRMVSGIGLN